MARIAGVELPADKRVEYGLTLIYGIGWPLAKKILIDAQIPENRRVRDLTEDELARLTKIVESYKVEGDLRREVRQNIQRLKDIGSYRGIRHSRNLPVRGQRTRTNARTKRGARKTVGAFKKEVLAKMASKQEKTASAN
jgi:small subunit ribosomal protein S13